MKKSLISISLLLLISLLFTGCNGSDASSTNTASTDTNTTTESKVVETPTPEPKSIPAVIAYNNGALLRNDPGGDTIYTFIKGETCTWLGFIEKGKDNRNYYKIKNNDGDEGWVLNLAVAVNAHPAVVVTSELLLTKDGKSYSDYEIQSNEIVAVYEDTDDIRQGYYLIAYSPTNNHWPELTQGLIPKESVTLDAADIDAISFIQSVIDIDPTTVTELLEDKDMNEKKREELLKKLELQSKKLTGALGLHKDSVFGPFAFDKHAQTETAIAETKAAIAAAKAAENTPEEETMEDAPEGE